MGLWSAIRGGLVGSVASGLIGNVFASHNAAKQAAMQRQTWAYQQGNAHQLEVEDLKAAGLNPILSATNSQMAGMAPAPPMSDNGVGTNISNSLTDALNRQANLEIEKTKADIALTEAKAAATNARTNAISAGIRGDDISMADKRFVAETANIDADTSLKTSAKEVNESQSRYLDIQGRELVRLTDAQIDSIYSHMANESALTSAQISEIETKKEVNSAQVKALGAQAKEAVERSNLTYWQKQEVIQDISSSTRALENLTAQQRYQYLSSPMGKLQHQAGFGLSLMNPFTNFGVRVGSSRFGSSRK